MATAGDNKTVQGSATPTRHFMTFVSPDPFKHAESCPLSKRSENENKAAFADESANETAERMWANQQKPQDLDLLWQSLPDAVQQTRNNWGETNAHLVALINRVSGTAHPTRVNQVTVFNGTEKGSSSIPLDAWIKESSGSWANNLVHLRLFQAWQAAPEDGSQLLAYCVKYNIPVVRYRYDNKCSCGRQCEYAT
jgi:hypothetical protein